MGAFAGCCARAASGHTAAVPPSSVMNSRRCSRFDVDGQFELVRRLHRQVTRVGTFQDTVDIRRGALENIRGVRSVGDQGSFTDELPIAENRGDAMLCSGPDD